MKKILVILTMLVLVISCGKKGTKNDPFKDLGNKRVQEITLKMQDQKLSLRNRMEV